jgi:Uma2 family endonuclease
MVEPSLQQHLRSSTLTVPPLECGDRLNRSEFERRYAAMPHLKKAELVEGIVYMPAALRFRSHSQPHGRMMTWLGVYEATTPGVAVGDNPTVRLDDDNEPQPDAVMLIDEASGGQARISEEDYIEGAPELIVEIAASSAAIDLRDKKRAYCRNGVREYLVWQVFEQKLDWFYVEEDYHLLSSKDGIIRSQVFPGLWLAVSDLLTGNMSQVLAILQQGIASTDHTTFVHALNLKQTEP